MACTKCNEPITHICDQTPCVETQPCDCPIPNLQTKCLVYEGSDLVCSGIKKGTILTELIKQLDAYICKVKTDLINSFQLVNVGLGAKVFKGIDLLGRKEIGEPAILPAILTPGLVVKALDAAARPR